MFYEGERPATGFFYCQLLGRDHEDDGLTLGLLGCCFCLPTTRCSETPRKRIGEGLDLGGEDDLGSFWRPLAFFEVPVSAVICVVGGIVA